MENPTYCSRCGKNMDDDKGTKLIGSMITVKVAEGQDAEFVKRQLGKYRIGEVYSFCYECWLDSLMGNRDVCQIKEG